MPIDYQGSPMSTCYATCSIGHDEAAHTLPLKLKAIADAGFYAVELSTPDILFYDTLNGEDPNLREYDALV